MATSPLPSRGRIRGPNCYVTAALLGAPTAKRGNKIKSCYLTPALSGPERGRNCYATPTFSGAPDAKRGERIRNACLTPTFSVAQKRAESLRNPCILGGPQRQARGKNQKWEPHP